MRSYLCVVEFEVFIGVRYSMRLQSHRYVLSKYMAATVVYLSDAQDARFLKVRLHWCVLNLKLLLVLNAVV